VAFVCKVIPFQCLNYFNLINGARNEAGDILLVAEDEGEGGREGGHGLDGGKHDLPDVGAQVEPENAANLEQKKQNLDHLVLLYTHSTDTKTFTLCS
jgi:hypothetical protein